MEETREGRQVSIWWVALLAFLVIALAVAQVYFVSELSKTKQELSTCKYAYNDALTKLEGAQNQLTKLHSDVDSCEKSLDKCRLDKLSLEMKYDELNKDFQIVVEFFIRYDQLLQAEQYYAAVEYCDDFLQHYAEMKDYADGMLDFLRKYGSDIKRIFNDELAIQYGYDSGISVSDLRAAILQFKSNLDYTYNYCMEG